MLHHVSYKYLYDDSSFQFKIMLTFSHILLILTTYNEFFAGTGSNYP